MKVLISLIIQAIAVFITAYILPGVRVDGFMTAFLVAIVLAVLNTLLKPILVVLTLPITILTLGLFYFILNAVVILIASALVPGFVIHGLFTALLFSIVLSVVKSVLNLLTNEK
jgi:putative membrane protein